ncbi:hypothetical protein PZA11_003652 [Diplocarpon coronariae]
MKLSGLVFALAIPQIVAGHSVFTNLWVDNINQGDGTCVRMAMDPGSATDPINDLQSNNMACGFDGTQSVARVCPVREGAKLSFEFREWADKSKPGAIDGSHKGPCSVYMKNVGSAINDTGVGEGWFKITTSGYDYKTSKWCTELLEANNGFFSYTIPNDLAGGYYLVRPELLALQEADKIPPNPQFYVGCAQIFLDSEATALPRDTVSIPGYVDISNPSVLFDIYNPQWPYPEPGPRAYEAGKSRIREVKPLEEQTEGLLPQNVEMVNANWWGVKLDNYHTEAGCWNASKACYGQATTCYETAPPTGSKNCTLWEENCNGIRDACDKSVFDGPPKLSDIVTE